MPFKAEPVLMKRLWGGQKLKKYNKQFGEEKIGESWETDKDMMPVLIKLIDGEELLSVQVHPNDEMAEMLEHQRTGKTEAWVVLECSPGAELIAGLKEGVGPRDVMEALEKNKLQGLLRTVKVKRGDCIYIPAGTIHSLGKGIVVYEVQQPSDITYRLYDWNRLDATGKPRELHVDKALCCIDYRLPPVSIDNLYEQSIKPLEGCKLFENEYFSTDYMYCRKYQKQSFQTKAFTAVTLISGSLWIYHEGERTLLQKGDTWIVEEAGVQVNLQALESTELLITENRSTAEILQLD